MYIRGTVLPERDYWTVVGNVGADGLDGQPVNTPNRFHGVPTMQRQPGAPYTGDTSFLPPTYDAHRFHEAQVQHRADAYSWEYGLFLVENATGRIFVGHIDPATLTYSYIPLADPTAEVIDPSTWVADPYTDNNSGHLIDPTKAGPIDANIQYQLAYGPGGGPKNPQDAGYGAGYYGYHAPAALVPTNTAMPDYIVSPGPGTGFDNGDAPPGAGTATVAIETSGQSGGPGTIAIETNAAWNPAMIRPLMFAAAGAALLLLSSTKRR